MALGERIRLEAVGDSDLARVAVDVEMGDGFGGTLADLAEGCGLVAAVEAVAALGDEDDGAGQDARGGVVAEEFAGAAGEGDTALEGAHVADAVAAPAAQVRAEGGFDTPCAGREGALVGGAALAFGEGQVGLVEDPCPPCLAALRVPERMQ